MDIGKRIIIEVYEAEHEEINIKCKELNVSAMGKNLLSAISDLYSELEQAERANEKRIWGEYFKDNGPFAIYKVM